VIGGIIVRRWEGMAVLAVSIGIYVVGRLLSAHAEACIAVMVIVGRRSVRRNLRVVHAVVLVAIVVVSRGRRISSVLHWLPLGLGARSRLSLGGRPRLPSYTT
jgi:hypothetical protein